MCGRKLCVHALLKLFLFGSSAMAKLKILMTEVYVNNVIRTDLKGKTGLYKISVKASDSNFLFFVMFILLYNWLSALVLFQSKY